MTHWFSLASSYVLIRTEHGKEGELAENLRKIRGVTEVYILYGIFDILAKVEAESFAELKALIAWQIRRLEEVRSTLTLIIAEPEVSLDTLRTKPLVA